MFSFFFREEAFVKFEISITSRRHCSVLIKSSIGELIYSTHYAIHTINYRQSVYKMYYLMNINRVSLFVVELDANLRLCFA